MMTVCVIGLTVHDATNLVDDAGRAGQSKVFKKPAFQKGLIKKDKMRDVPDISLSSATGTPGIAVYDCSGMRSEAAPMVDGGSLTDEARAKMEQGLTAFVEGRVVRDESPWQNA